MKLHVHSEYQYLALLAELLQHGDRRLAGHSKAPVRSLFGKRLEFDLAEGFPLLTTKKLHHRLIIGELLWMLGGETNVRALQAQGINIWDEWADEIGDLGPVYGHQWRSWTGRTGEVDQIAAVIKSLRDTPNDRAHLVSAWNVGDLPDMALRPCHCLFQFYVEPGERLSCQLYQRSGDAFLGVPFNIASYSLLTMMIARVLGMPPGRFIHVFGDVHLYENHVEAALQQVGRQPTAWPTMQLPTDRTSIDGWQMSDFTLRGYQAQAHIPAAVTK